MPIIPLSEPVSARYIYIDPDTNIVHLMVPLVNGQEISTDNTCRSGLALKDFFEGGALQALNAYKEALVFDIALLAEGEIRRSKQERLAQIEVYIQTVAAMRRSYGDAIIALLKRPSNVYSFQLRPRIQDHVSRVVNPVFTVERRNALDGTPLSALYYAMHDIYGAMAVAAVAPRTRLTTAALAALPASSFEDIQRVLGEQSVALFGLTIDFSRQTNGMPVTKEAIDKLMGFGEDATPADYIDAFVGACAQDVWAMIPTPPFYSISEEMPVAERTEKFSIITQFFLANLNVYCKARGISTQNFGEILDNSVALSNELVTVISTALTNGEDVEQTIYNFFNTHQITFHLSRLLNADDLTAIRGLFERTYRTITATRENIHFDDGMLLDKGATGDMAIFGNHQGSICVDFARIVDLAVADMAPEHFRRVLAAPTRLTEIPHRNEFVAGAVDIDVEILLARINEEQFERLPAVAKEACRAHPSFQMHYFLHDVAKGRQMEAEALLTPTPANTQTLLRTPGIFTDYSGRTFNCTAYEYAYWAKDTHMCRMLEAHMDEETKAQMLARIDAIEAGGLAYQQNGEAYQSAHFDLTALKTTLQAFIDGYAAWYAARNWVAMYAAWMEVGKAQRDVPVHVAQEYCRPDRSFDPTPKFNEATLPRLLTIGTFTIGRDGSWFPLTAPSSGLGFDFTLVRGAATRARYAAALGHVVWGFQTGELDLAAVSRLDEVRTVDLTLSREHLKPSALPQSMSV